MKLIPLLDCIPSVIQYCAMASHNRNVKTNAGQSIHSGLKCNYMNKNCFVTTRTSVLMIFFSSPEPRCDCPPPPPSPNPICFIFKSSDQPMNSVGVEKPNRH